MVVLSAAITTRNGKALLARQFVDMSRIRIEGLLAAFPKLMGTGNKQHTFIETDSVRYVYQPMESLFLLLLTNKASNILEDLETLRTLSKVVPDVAGGLTEDKVNGKAFELVFAFDEVITTGGHKENIPLSQIMSYMEMDSHEERLHNMIQDSKREAAKEEAGRRAKELREKQKEMSLRPSGMGGGMPGIEGGGRMLGGGVYTDESNYRVNNASSFGTGGSGGIGSWSRTGGSDSTRGFPVNAGSSAPVTDTPSIPLHVPSMGMKLEGPSKRKTTLDALMKEDHLSVPQPKRVGAGGADVAVPAAVVPAAVHPVSLSVEERLNCQLTREGTLESMEVKGTLSLTVNNEAAKNCKVAIGSLDSTGAFSFQTHPKVNKGLYDSSKALALKDQAKGFPVARPVGVLRWSLNTTNDSHLPLTINCWPESDGGGQMNVNMEYELVRPMELHDVRISIPLGSSAVPQIAAVDGTHRHNAQEGTLLWSMELLDQSNRTGSLEFNVASRDPEAFFPITVTFMSTQLFCNVQVSGVMSTETNAPMQYGYAASLVTESYSVS